MLCIAVAYSDGLDLHGASSFLRSDLSSWRRCAMCSCLKAIARTFFGGYMGKLQEPLIYQTQERIGDLGATSYNLARSALLDWCKELGSMRCCRTTIAAQSRRAMQDSIWRWSSATMSSLRRSQQKLLPNYHHVLTKYMHASSVREPFARERRGRYMPSKNIEGSMERADSPPVLIACRAVRSTGNINAGCYTFDIVVLAGGHEKQNQLS